jgi:hypothetical protein
MLEIAIDISVIKLYGIQEHSLGSVVEKFRALIKKRRVILVAFYDEVFARTKPIPVAKVLTQAPNKKPWPTASLF